MRRIKNGAPIARLELDAPRRMIEAALLTVGGYAETTRQIGKGDYRIPPGEMVGIYFISPGTPPNRLIDIVWIHPDERTQVQVVGISERDLRPVTDIVLAADMSPKGLLS